MQDDEKHKFFAEIGKLHRAYLPEQGGLVAYVSEISVSMCL